MLGLQTLINPQDNIQVALQVLFGFLQFLVGKVGVEVAECGRVFRFHGGENNNAIPDASKASGIARRSKNLPLCPARHRVTLEVMKSFKEAAQNTTHQQSIPTVSTVSRDGAMLEMVCQPAERRTGFVLWRDGAWSIQQSVSVDPLHQLVPYSYHNNLVKNQVVLFPSEPEEYGSTEALLAEIQAFIHRHVDVSPLFEKLASYYVLFTWVYDGFNELPYLRVRGDTGTGKTRFLLTIGSLCYKPIFASGASTVSPIFRMLDSFHGTLIVDEGDFRFSDEKAEVV